MSYDCSIIWSDYNTWPWPWMSVTVIRSVHMCRIHIYRRSHRWLDSHMVRWFVRSCDISWLMRIHNRLIMRRSVMRRAILRTV